MALSTELGRLLSALREQKHPFAAVREALARVDKEAGGGWDKLPDKIGDYSAEDQAAIGAQLSKLILNRAVAGQKDLHIFHLEDDEIAAISSGLLGLAAAGPYAATFPLPLTPTQLSGKTGELFLSNVIYRENSDVSLVFCATRIEYDKTPYEINHFNQAVQTAFEGYDRVVAIKRSPYQIFDVFNFRPGLKRIEVLVDQPNRMSSDEDSEERCTAILAMVANRCGQLLSVYENNSPLNLYSCINSMYLDANEGKIKRLAFRAPSQSQKKEQLTSEDDLRTEDFHAAGVLKVGVITVHDISLHWATLPGGAGEAKARIKINVGDLSNQGAYVRYAEIFCTTDSAVTVIANKLVAHSTT